MSIQLRIVTAASALALSLPLTALATGAARAQDGDIAFNAAVTTDYVYRGVSQSSEDFAVSGGVDFTTGPAYFGAWASTVDFGEDTKAEIDLYGGFRPTVGAFTLDVGVIGYFYVDQPHNADYDFVEAKVAASTTVGPATVGAQYFYSPDFFGAEDEAHYLQADVSVAPMEKLTVSASVGKQWLESDFDYVNWNVGATWAFSDTLVGDVRYHDTDEHDFGDIYDSRVVATLKVLL